MAGDTRLYDLTVHGTLIRPSNSPWVRCAVSRETIKKLGQMF
jgi:hypothetical protein